MKRVLLPILAVVALGLGLLLWELRDASDPFEASADDIERRSARGEMSQRPSASGEPTSGGSAAERLLSAVVDDPTLADGDGDLTLVRGKVVDSETGSGIEGLKVLFGRRASTTSKAGGEFEIKLRPGNYQVTATGPDYLGEPYRLPLLEITPDEIVLKVTRAAVVSGKVTKGGRPVSGAEVSFKTTKDGETIRGLKLASDIGATSTASDGSYELRVLPGEVEIIARSDEGRGKNSIGVIEAGQRKQADIDVPANLEISGTVTDPSGRPIENALVSVHPFGPGVSSADFRRVRTDANGRYRVDNAFPGRLAIEAMVEGEGHTGPRTLTLYQNTTRNLQMGPGQTISGRLTRDGSPVVGYKVRAVRPTMRLRIESYTDSSGDFEIHGLGKYRYEIVVYKPGNGREVVGELMAPTSGAELELRD